MSWIDLPAVEQITGLPAAAMTSRSGQSRALQLATFTMSTSCSRSSSTEGSSKGVTMVSSPAWRVAVTRRRKSRAGRRVAEEARDVLHVGAACVVGVDEGVEVAVLELHRRPYAVAPGDPTHLGDDAQPVLHVALVVVRDLEDEEEVRKGLGHAVLLLGYLAGRGQPGLQGGEGNHPIVDVVVGRRLAEAQLVVAHPPAGELLAGGLAPVDAGHGSAGGVDHDAVPRSWRRLTMATPGA